MALKDLLRVEVVYALPDREVTVALSVPHGTTTAEALAQSRIAERHPEVCGSKMGIFGRIVAPETRLDEGDRVEIYRPLLADPKQARRRRAAGML